MYEERGEHNVHGLPNIALRERLRREREALGYGNGSMARSVAQGAVKCKIMRRTRHCLIQQPHKALVLALAMYTYLFVLGGWSTSMIQLC
jgi:hypothetical protein